MKLDTTAFKKALSAFESAVLQVEKIAADDPLKNIVRDGAIQRFEYTYEISWKMIKRYLDMYMAEKADELTAKDLFRRGAEAGLIIEPAKWFVFREAMNKTSHTYNKSAADEVYAAAKEFLSHAKELYNNLEKKI